MLNAYELHKHVQWKSFWEKHLSKSQAEKQKYFSFFPYDWLLIEASHNFFVTTIWLPHGQLWAILKGTVSLTQY